MNMLAIEELIKKLSTKECDTLQEDLKYAIWKKNFYEILKPALIDAKSNLIVCPVCGSTHIVKNGFDAFHDQRYLCKNASCKRKSFTLKADTLMYYSKCTPQQWMLFFECLFNRDSIAKTMEKVGVCENTVLLWRHKTMHLLNSLVNTNTLKGFVYLDETFVNVGNKGIEDTAKVETKPKRGMSRDKINIACAIDEHNHTIIKVSDTGRITSDSLIDVYTGHMDATNTVVSDSLRSYHRLFSHFQVTWIKIPSGKKSYKGYTLDPINHLHGEIKRYLGEFRGVATHYLQGYLSLFSLLREYKKYHYPKVIRHLISKIISLKMTLRCYDFDSSYEYS